MMRTSIYIPMLRQVESPHFSRQLLGVYFHNPKKLLLAAIL